MRLTPPFGWRPVICLAFCLLGGCSKTAAPHEYETIVRNTVGQHLFLEDGNQVALIGVYIPIKKDVNYIPELEENLKAFVVGKKILIRTKVAKKSNAFPKIDLVEAVKDKVNINKQLLKSGAAFFFENYWDPREKEEYRALESYARNHQIGLWKNQARLKVLYVRHRNWRFAYHPDSPKVRDLPEKDKIVYYTPLPYQQKGIMSAVFDNFSMEQWLTEKEKEELKQMRMTGWDQL